MLFRLQVSGQDHIPRTGGVLIAANHTSYLDIPILGCALPRQASFIGRMDLFSGIVGTILRYLGWIPIRRERVDRKAFDEAVARLGGNSLPGRAASARQARDRYDSGGGGLSGSACSPRRNVRSASSGSELDPSPTDQGNLWATHGFFRGTRDRERGHEEGRIPTNESRSHGQDCRTSSGNEFPHDSLSRNGK